MNLPTEVFGEVIVVHAPEELAAEQAELFADFVPQLERQRVVLDLDGTETLDGGGLEALLEVQERLRGIGGDLKVSAAGAVNRKILEITRLDTQLEVFTSVLDAVKSYR